MSFIFPDHTRLARFSDSLLKILLKCVHASGINHYSTECSLLFLTAIIRGGVKIMPMHRYSFDEYYWYSILTDTGDIPFGENWEFRNNVWKYLNNMELVIAFVVWILLWYFWGVTFIGVGRVTSTLKFLCLGVMWSIDGLMDRPHVDLEFKVCADKSLYREDFEKWFTDSICWFKSVVF